MIFGYDKRIVMGPERNGALYGVVALVPDKDLREDSKGNSWTSQGSVEDLLESVQEFPEPMREILRRSDQGYIVAATRHRTASDLGKGSDHPHWRRCARDVPGRLCRN